MAAVTLFTAPVAFADDGHKSGLDRGLHLGQIVHARIGAILGHEGRGDGDSDADDVHAQASASLRAQIKEKFSHIAAGVVTSVSGSVFIIDPFGPKSTTTVSTNASTAFKVKGEATTSSALHIGSKVFLVGTTTATSTTGDSFSASLVALIGKGLGHIRFWMWFH